MREILIKIIEQYQKYLSPILQKGGVHCKYYPSCSEYTKQAINKYGCIARNNKRFFQNMQV